MLMLFEVFLAPGHEQDELLSLEALETTHAQVMTPEDAERVGFAGIPNDPRPRLFIACAAADGGLVRNRLEGSHAVSAYNIHEVPT